ncbi:MAG TPA: PilC/PilY family type IV pilus protein, partial [Rhodanobacteraceae bacterium]|nr:PilC/PilY family type IV pilus protein [Rhodanobacteraceae bacterium]
PTSGSGNCKFQYYPVHYYFQYSTSPKSPTFPNGDPSGPYTVHYVAQASNGGCDSQPNCVLDTDVGNGTNGAPVGVTVGENIANWFAYYHTRLLMAKSGLMTAFSGLDPTFRVGFGSINGRNAVKISGFPDPYKFSTSTQSNNYLAGVAPFGKASDASTTAGISRFNFWDWVKTTSADKTTPLREALDAVGQYYQDETTASKAWNMMPSDPGYVAGVSDGTKIACRQAYTILTTDGFWNGSYTSTTTKDASDTAGDATGSAVTGPNGQSYTYNAAAPYSGGNTNDGSPSLADVAMYYWKNDLQSGLVNEVPLPSKDKKGMDPAFWQHMVTFTLGMGFTPQYADETQIPMDQVFAWARGGAPIVDWPGWPTPSASDNGSINNVADLAHAGVNGHGGFFSANNPQSFVTALKGALKRVTEQTRTGASLAANSTQLTTKTVIYQSTYQPSAWTGDLSAFAVNAATGEIAPNSTWQASSAIPAAASRTIETYNPDTAKFQSFTAANLTGLSSAQQSALGSDATTQENVINYLRGDSTNEDNDSGFRERDTVLGDIVDSQPVFSGPPDPNEFINQTFFGTTVDSGTKRVPFYDWAVGITDTTSGTFTASAASKRANMIYVAANDGMLHAFDATTGVEAFAYLPGAVITAGLADLADPAYGSDASPHQFYNDGQLTIADAYVKLPSDTSPQWHTILVGTTGRGTAKAVYALDVTDPANITPLWERSAGDGLPGADYIGQMVGKPIIAQTNYTPASGGTPASSTWSVLMGNGYNSAQDKAALLQFNLATGTLDVHTTDGSTGNGLAAPVVWMDNPGDGVGTVAYAGDLLGQVWQFPLNDASGANPTPDSIGTKLFTATDASGNAQPITSGMLAGKDSRTSDVWLFFGTGKYLSSADIADTTAQTWYGIIVQSGTSKIVSNLQNGRSALVQRTITAQTTGSGALPARTVSTQVTNTDGSTDMKGKSGWYLDLLAPIGTAGAPVAQGERMVDPNQFQGSLLIGVTRIPQAADVCNPSGSGWIMAINPFTGAAPSDDFFDVNNDSYINVGDQVNGSHAAGVGFSSLPNAPIFVGGVMETSFDNGSVGSLKTAGTVGVFQRVSWRELVHP